MPVTRSESTNVDAQLYQLMEMMQDRNEVGTSTGENGPRRNEVGTSRGENPSILSLRRRLK